MVPQEGQDYDDYDSRDGKKPAFSFDNDTTMNLDGPGYALSLLLIGEIVILAMAFFAGGLNFGGRSFPPLAPITVSKFPLIVLTHTLYVHGVQKKVGKNQWIQIANTTPACSMKPVESFKLCTYTIVN